jgi:hypothetical protein
MPSLGATHTLHPVSRPKVVLRFAKHLRGFGSGSWFLGNVVPSQTSWAYDFFDSHQLLVPVTAPKILSQMWFWDQRMPSVPSLGVGGNLEVIWNNKLEIERKSFQSDPY